MAYKDLLKLARKGNPIDQLNLANAFYTGDGDTPFDYKFAQKWYIRAAKQGNADAQYYAGYGYKYGKGVRQDNFKAVKWFKLSAQQGHDKAQYHLAYAYEKMLGCEWNEQKALDLYLASASQGNVNAMFKMGKIYDEAQLGQAEDVQKAFAWFKKASEKGHLEATNNVGDCYETGRGVAQDYDKAFAYYKKCATDHCPIGQYSLALCYLKGIGTDKNSKKAMELLTKSANNNCAEAQYELGMYYYDESQNDNAFRWLKKATENGHTRAPMYLGCCYGWGMGVQKDYAMARHYLKPFADQGDKIAQYAMAMCLIKGDAKQRQQAVSYCKASANQDYLQAMELLCEVLKNDNYVPHDYNESIYWGEKAIKQGSTNLYFSLAYAYSNLGDIKSIKKAIKFYEMVEGEDEPVAQYNLSVIKFNKANQEVCNMSAAFAHAQKAVALGYGPAKALVGRHYILGKGTLKNYAKGYQLIYESDETNGLREFLLGQIYYNGYGKPVDYAKAYSYYSQAADKGDKSAFNNMGCCYYHGRGVHQNDEQAVYWFKRGVEVGDEVAYFNLADCYYNGYGVAKDRAYAITLAQKSLELGYEPAADMLKKWGVR